jgi:molecular chaperone DnaK (HSP70)
VNENASATASRRLVVGIDLGTTNSLAAIRAGRNAHVLRDQDGEPLIPSVVCFHPDGRTIVGRAAKALRLQFPDRTVFSVKRLIGRSAREVLAEGVESPFRIVAGDRDLPRIRIGDRDYAPEAISALVLQQVKATAEQALGQPVREAVVTVPAWFDDAQRQATKHAAALAGLDCLRILNEPTAAAEGLKIRLSTADIAELELDLGSHGTAKLAITRAEFEAAIAPLVQRTIDQVQRAVRDAGLRLEQIDDVVLVGGSTRVPLVRARLLALTGRPPHTGVDPDLAVALGAAIQADVLAGNDRSLLLLDVIPLSLGIETLGGAMQKLILRNSTIPTAVTEEFSTGVDNQTAVDLAIYQGERELAKDCRLLGHFQLRGLPALPAGLPRIAVTFLVDADGVLRVTAREQRTGLEAGITVVPSFGLTRDEVHRMMQESIEHAAADWQAREAIDVRNKAEALVRGTRKALQLAELPPDQSWTVQKALHALAALLEKGGDTAALKAACDELSKATATIADDVISTAVTKALREEQQR